MYFSFRLVAAAAFLLPSLISAAAIPNDGLATRDTSLNSREASNNIEIMRRKVEDSFEDVQAKRNAYDEALAAVNEITARGELVSRTTEAELQAVYDAYKAAKAQQSGLKALYVAERDWATKLDIANRAITAVQGEINGRATAQPMYVALGRSPDVIANHQTELDKVRACLVTWNKRRDAAAKKVPAPAGTAPC